MYTDNSNTHEYNMHPSNSILHLCMHTCILLDMLAHEHVHAQVSNAKPQTDRHPHADTVHAVTARQVARESKVERHSAIFRELDGIRRQVRFRDLECICRLPAHGPFKRLYLQFQALLTAALMKLGPASESACIRTCGDQVWRTSDVPLRMGPAAKSLYSFGPSEASGTATTATCW